MSYDFKNDVAIITGAAGGIGLEVAREFLALGATVVLADRDVMAAAAAVRTLQAEGFADASYVACDIADEGNITRLYERVMEQYSRLDIVVNNAGIDGDLGSLDQQSTQNIDKVLSVNVRGTALSMREALRIMRRQGSGTIVNVASIAGHVGFAGSPIYTASKHAILGLTKAAALENAGNGIRVCAVSPGAVDTDMTNRFTGRNTAAKEAMISGIPLGRMCHPNEIARGIVFMASPDAALLVGQTLNLDGGWAGVKP